jgi:hypothetical protein
LAPAGHGSFSKVRFIEVSALPTYLQKMGLEELSESDKQASEATGYFALKVVRKTEVVRLKQVEHVKYESIIHWKIKSAIATRAAAAARARTV